MDIHFNSEHLATLKDLQEMAVRHNCIMNFGVRHSSNTEFSECSNLIKSKVPKKVFQAIEDGDIDLRELQGTCSSLWFELYDKETRKYNTLTYIEDSVYFRAEDMYSSYEEKPEVVEEWLSEGGYDGLDFYSYSHSPTIIHGFGYKKEHTDYRVYRSGMALKFFGDLVCKYLKEPMIARTY